MSDTFSVNDELKISFCPTLINTFVTWMINELHKLQHEHSNNHCMNTLTSLSFSFTTAPPT